MLLFDRVNFFLRENLKEKNDRKYRSKSEVKDLKHRKKLLGNFFIF